MASTALSSTADLAPVEAMWVGIPATLFDGTPLVPGETVCTIGADEARDSDHWRPLRPVPPRIEAPTPADIPDAAQPEQPDPAEPEPLVHETSVDDLLAYVGDDRSRAAAIAAAERSRPDGTARRTLLDRLDKIAEGA